jgi:PAS domain S-box-containing protein
MIAPRRGGSFLRDGHVRRLLQNRAVDDRTAAVHERTAFLADVGTVIDGSLDAAAALPGVARRVVPFLADGCVIDLADENGHLARAAAVHHDPAVGAALGRHYPPASPVHPLLARVLAERRSLLASHGHQADLGAADGGCWRPASALLVPLLARDRVLGVVSLFSSGPDRRFGADACTLADELARRIASSVDNARLARAADEANRSFHDLVEAVGAIAWEADADRRRHTFVSGHAVALLGHPLARWHDEPDFWVALQHPDDQRRSVAASAAARAEGRDHDLEYRVLTADGRIAWMLDRVRVVRQDDGRVRRLRGVMVDVTHGKRAEMAQREGEEARRQAAALASVAALANAAAHEINNPLSIIMGNLELFRRRPDVPGVVAGRAEAMLAAGRRIAGIVGSMRRITRLENVPSPSGLPAMLDLKRSSTADDA